MGFPRYHPSWLPSSNPLAPTARKAIGSSHNAGVAARTNGPYSKGRSPGQLERELQPAYAWRGFQSAPHASLLALETLSYLLTGLLSSVKAFHLGIGIIIFEMEELSRGQ